MSDTDFLSMGETVAASYVAMVSSCITQHCYVVVLLNGKLFAKLSDNFYRLWCVASLHCNQNDNTTYIEIKSDAIVAKPIYILSLITTPTLDGQLSKLMINVGANARVGVITESICLNLRDDAVSASTQIIEMNLQQHAQVDYYHIQNSERFVKHATHSHSNVQLKLNLDSSSVMTTNHLICGDVSAAKMHVEIIVALKSPGAIFVSNGLFGCNNQQRLQVKVVVNHFADHCSSKVLFKGIVADLAYAEFIGNIVVHAKAAHSIARLDNKNLLLHQTARVKTSPVLEVYADDVKCAHGATVGQLDESALWYLQTRGISYKGACEILLNAFMQEILHNLPLFLREEVVLHTSISPT